jgi:hypothetical protein
MLLEIPFHHSPIYVANGEVNMLAYLGHNSTSTLETENHLFLEETLLDLIQACIEHPYIPDAELEVKHSTVFGC